MVVSLASVKNYRVGRKTTNKQKQTIKQTNKQTQVTKIYKQGLIY